MEKELLCILKKYEAHPDFLGDTIKDINQAGGMDDTVLHIAARNNSLNDALVFLQNGALIDLKGDLGYTPLHYACMFGNIEMVKLLLDNGSDKNIQNEFGENAVRIAINSSSENKEKIVKLLIKNQMLDKQKNENALHLNTFLLSSIENPSIDNDCFIELFSYYSNLSQGEVSELFNLLQSLTKNEINIIHDFLEYISKFIKDLGLCCEFEKFLMEVKYIQERNCLEEKIRSTFPVFKVDKNNIISFDDSDNSYIFSIMQLSTKTWIEITYDDFLSILESLEWQAFTNKALLYFTPCCLKYIFSNLSKFHLYGYVVDFLYIALRNQSTIFNTTQINLIIDFLKLIQNFNQEISVETQKRITSTIQLYL